MKRNKTPFQQKLSEPIKLPSLAKNIHVLLQSLADDNLNSKQLAEVIKHYPDISARLIFIANSSWSAPISPINNLEQTCSRLGTLMVKSISIAISIASSFVTIKCPSFCTVHFWTTSMLAAEGAGMLASELPEHVNSLEFVQTAQTAGVLHNLGLLWLADNLPIETDKAFQMITDDSSSLSVSDALRLQTGTDYCEVGGWIARQLELPEIFIATMEHHPNHDYKESSWEIALLVGCAANMASALLKQAVKVETNPHLETLGLDSSSQDLVYQKLSRNFEKTTELAKTLFEG